MASFQDILNTPMDEIKAPKPLPPGEYVALIDGQPEITQRGKNQNHCVIFPLKLLEAVNVTPAFQQQLHEALEGKALTDVKLSTTFWVTPDSAYRLRNFLVDHLGIPSKMKPQEAIAMTQGRQLVVSLGHYITQREGEEPRVGMEVKSTAKYAA